MTWVGEKEQRGRGRGACVTTGTRSTQRQRSEAQCNPTWLRASVDPRHPVFWQRTAVDALQRRNDWRLGRVWQILIEALFDVCNGAVRHVAMRQRLERPAEESGVVPPLNTGGRGAIHWGRAGASVGGRVMVVCTRAPPVQRIAPGLGSPRAAPSRPPPPPPTPLASPTWKGVRQHGARKVGVDEVSENGDGLGGLEKATRLPGLAARVVASNGRHVRRGVAVEQETRHGGGEAQLGRCRRL